MRGPGRFVAAVVARCYVPLSIPSKQETDMRVALIWALVLCFPAAATAVPVESGAVQSIERTDVASEDPPEGYGFVKMLLHGGLWFQLWKEIGGTQLLLIPDPDYEAPRPEPRSQMSR
jgi:hypothetical protein